jgi:hypothetical protein
VLTRLTMMTSSAAGGSLGLYEEFSVLGTPTRRIAVADESGELPPVPHGFTWRPLSERPVAELRAQAADYRHMAEVAATLTVMAAFFRVAVRLEALAGQREREETRGALRTEAP